MCTIWNIWNFGCHKTKWRTCLRLYGACPTAKMKVAYHDTECPSQRWSFINHPRYHTPHKFQTWEPSSYILSLDIFGLVHTVLSNIIWKIMSILKWKYISYRCRFKIFFLKNGEKWATFETRVLILHNHYHSSTLFSQIQRSFLFKKNVNLNIACLLSF